MPKGSLRKEGKQTFGTTWQSQTWPSYFILNGAVQGNVITIYIQLDLWGTRAYGEFRQAARLNKHQAETGRREMVEFRVCKRRVIACGTAVLGCAWNSRRTGCAIHGQTTKGHHTKSPASTPSGRLITRRQTRSNHWLSRRCSNPKLMPHYL